LIFRSLRDTNILFSTPSSETSGDNHKNEGFLKSVWHKLTDKNCDSSKPEAKDTKDAGKGKGNAGKDESKKT
jgi:molecular chaperone DnaJ